MSTTTLPARRKIDVDAYHRMAEAGIFAPDERVELIDGEILQMVPIGSEHGATVIRLNRLFDPAALHHRAIVAVQSPLRLDATTEPVPDLMLLRSRPDDYRDALPGPQDVLLVVEVAKSSLDYDRSVKAPLYARAGVGELWIVDLVGRAVEVAKEPGADGFAVGERVTRGRLAPQALSDVAIDVATLFAA
jgi:hypothetical protein